MTVKIAPSILAADFGHLAHEITDVVARGADWIHVDVMDGRFVPNLTLGPVIVKAAREAAGQVPLDVHLMILEPERYLQDFCEAGANTLTVHVEASPHLHRTLQAIRQLGCLAGVSLNPHTPEDVLDYVLEDLDLILVMSVNPGFGGQSLIDATVRKVARIREKLDARGLSHVELEVDGGIKPDNAWKLVEAGATVLVSGSGVFGAPDRTAAIAALRAGRRPTVVLP